MRWRAAYRCNRCMHTWMQDAGPCECPNCGFFLSVKWLNFEKLRADNPWHAQYPEPVR